MIERIRDSINPANDPGINFLLDGIVLIVIGLATLIALLVLAAQWNGARRAFGDPEATLANHVQAGLLSAVFLILASIGMGARDSSSVWLAFFTLLAVAMLWARVWITGNILLDTFIPAAVVGWLGWKAISGVQLIYAGGLDWGIWGTFVLLVGIGAVLSRLVNWTAN